MQNYPPKGYLMLPEVCRGSVNMFPQEGSLREHIEVVHQCGTVDMLHNSGEFEETH